MTRILFLYARGGAPLEYALPKFAERGEVHVLALQPMPAATEPLWRQSCARVTDASNLKLTGAQLVEYVTGSARAIGADAVVTLSEHAVMLAAEVSACLGLRGAGHGVERSRDKRLMRQTWRAAGVPVPAFVPVRSPEDLREALGDLVAPLLLKSAWGAGSLGQLVVRSPNEVEAAWEHCHESLARACASGPLEYMRPGAEADLLAEEIVVGDADAWMPDVSGYGDYLSVEGLVLDGVYHPIAVTSRLPTIPPFTELGSVAPCVLPDHLQKVVEEAARGAVDALGLRSCGTHTELKLTARQQVVVIESAARFGGVMIAKQMEDVFEVDPIGLLIDHLLGRSVVAPDRMLTATDATGAAASVVLIGTDVAGRPWNDDLVWDSTVVDWAELVSPTTEVTPVPGLTIPNGSRFPRYGASDGSRCAGGVIYLRAPEPETVVRDSHRIINGLEAALRQGHERRHPRRGVRTNPSR